MSCDGHVDRMKTYIGKSSSSLSESFKTFQTGSSEPCAAQFFVVKITYAVSGPTRMNNVMCYIYLCEYRSQISVT